MHPSTALQLSAARTGELRAEAARAGLVRLATCCRPSAWRAAATSVLARLRPQPCCA